MAQYYTDFSEYDANDTPSNMGDWTVEINEEGGFQVVTDAAYEGGTAFHVEGRYGMHEFVSWDGKNGSDVEVAVLIESQTENWDSIFPVCRGKAGTLEESYAARYFGGSLEILHITGNITVLNSHDISISAPFWIRFRVNGSDLSAKIWEKGASEPDSWHVETTDSNESSGLTGLGSWGDKGDYDVVGVGTGGDTAPTDSSVERTISFRLSASVDGNEDSETSTTDSVTISVG